MNESKKVPGSGRQKGTPNRRTQRLAEVLEEGGINVPLRLLRILPKLPPEKQADVLLGLMPYLYPKRKPQEPSALSFYF